jgi:tRNA pseudouridine38-40 synthase
MPRYRMTIEYDGTPFVGWQIQADGRSIQGCLTEAIRRFTGETVTVKGAGRTDAGVHARGQVAHFELARDWEPFKVREALNFHLKPDPIVVLDAAVADDRFDARFSATGRSYLYRILARKAPAALERNRVWWVPRPLDPAAMAEAAALMIGRHDFTTFRAAGCQAASPVKTLDVLDVTVCGEEIHIAAAARSFLHHQVRSLAGSLKHVGEGKWSPADMRAALDARDRARCGAMAPSRGLYLMAVAYGPPPWPAAEPETPAPAPPER